jgi:hypothetical protein
MAICGDPGFRCAHPGYELRTGSRDAHQITRLAGLDPAIHPFRKTIFAKKMDARVKPAHDAVFDLPYDAGNCART